MDIPKTSLVLLILSCLLIHELEMHTVEGQETGKVDCNAKCSYRCSKASRHNLCLRACNSCCLRCNCVPPGTSGNRESCPCYANITTHGGKLKCP